MNKGLILVLVLLFTMPVVAGEAPASTDKPAIYTSQTALLTATVETIDHKTREVTLRDMDGNSKTIVVGEEARNLDQVSVGDTLNIEFMQSMSIEVFAAENAEAGIASAAAGGRSEKGEMPGVAALETTIINAVVEEINLEANTFKLKGPDGEVTEFTARNPENLKRAAVGDLVVITMTEAVAITVEKKAGK